MRRGFEEAGQEQEEEEDSEADEDDGDSVEDFAWLSEDVMAATGELTIGAALAGCLSDTSDDDEAGVMSGGGGLPRVGEEDGREQQFMKA